MSWFNMTKLVSIDLNGNQITSFDVKGLRHMLSLIELRIMANNLTTLGNAYLWCTGKTCTNLVLIMHNNHQMIYDSRVCWMKSVGTISVNVATHVNVQCPGKLHAYYIYTSKGSKGKGIHLSMLWELANSLESYI